MISKTEKKRIIKHIGKTYTASVIEELDACNEKNSKGESYSASMVTNVMNGQPNEVIEAAIYRVVQQKKHLRESRKRLLTANP